MDKGSDESGPSSSSSTSADNDSNKQHLNKAQFLWQIKGKYSFQEDLSSSEYDESSPYSDTPTDSSTKDNSDVPAPNKSVSDTGNVALIEDLSDAVDDPSEDPFQDSSSSHRAAGPEWSMLKWQRRQEVKAFIDNSVNCVLESMGFVPYLTDGHNLLMNDGILEHEAVSMAILSHGLQRSDHDTPTTSSNVFSSNSYSAGPKSVQFPDYQSGISDIAKIRCVSRARQAVAPCSSSSKWVFEGGDVEMEIPSIVNITGEQSRVDLITPLGQQSFTDKSDPASILSATQTDCDVNSSLIREETQNVVTNELPVSCSCNPSKKLMSSQNEKFIPFHKRKANDSFYTESSKRCCNENIPVQNKIDLSQDFTRSGDSPSNESVSNVQSVCDKVPSFEHFDFMDAAVAVAIQKKGLSAMTCTEYG